MLVEIRTGLWIRLQNFSSHCCSSMALYSRVVLYGWTCLCVGYCAMLKSDSLPERRTVGLSPSADAGRPLREDGERDTMTEHMQMLYAKYNQAGFPFKDGNTVRGFKAHWGKCPFAPTFTHQRKPPHPRARLQIVVNVIGSASLSRGLCSHLCVIYAPRRTSGLWNLHRCAQILGSM